MSGKWAGAVLLVGLLVGCKGQPPEPVSVKGKVQDEAQKPLPEMVLTFHPVDENNKNARIEPALTTKDGSFALRCLKGRYKVTMVPIPRGSSKAGGPGGFVPGPAELGPGRDVYADPQRTPWVIDVPENGKEGIMLTVK